MILTVGIFDLFHEGHANLLRAMQERDKVVVVIHDDASTWHLKGRFPVQSAAHRQSNLRKSGFVHASAVTPDVDPGLTICDLFDFYPIDRFMRGDDMPDFPGREMVEKLDIPIEFLPYTEGVSSSLRREAVGA